MLTINVSTDTLSVMVDWLKNEIRDEKQLRKILNERDYKVEFERYGLEGLPTCGISFEEAVDFFMNFDKKDFDNPRLQMKKESFINFYNNMEEALKSIDLCTQINADDINEIQEILNNALPKDLVEKEKNVTILLTISIGNSFGWVYDDYVDFDVTNMGYIHNKQELLHLIAHELHHSFFPELIPEEMSSEQFFLINFAYEGLAVHFTNNLATINKKSKYDEDCYCMEEADMKLYEAEFDELFNQFDNDYNSCKALSFDEVGALVENHYEQFEYTSLKTGKKYNIKQYPTYYLGCYFYGLIDLYLGKDVLFDLLANPEKLVDGYNRAVRLSNNEKYLLK